MLRDRETERRREPRGISLLEVLFAIFVLAVGLLGLAAMVPVGKFQVSEANHADRSVAIGLAAHREIKVRDYLDDEGWTFYNFGNSTFEAFVPATPAPFIIDPLAITGTVAGTPDAQYSFFPYGTANFQPTAPPLAKLPRISLWGPESKVPMGAALADRIFRATNDLILELPDDKTRRPIQVNSTGSPQEQSHGDYSWLFMVSPPVNEGGPSVVSVVVFHKRDLVIDTSAGAVPSERFVFLDLVNGGLGASFGGDAQLRVTGLTAPPTGTTADFAAKLLKVRPNQWILVSGQTVAPDSAPVHKWYRVAAVSDMQSTADPWVVDVTLAGPDTEVSRVVGASTVQLMRDMDGVAGNGPTMFATICDGVVGVFEKRIQLDEPSLWTSH